MTYEKNQARAGGGEGRNPLTIIFKTTHVTEPLEAALVELDKGVDIRFAPSTAADNRIFDQWHLGLR